MKQHSPSTTTSPSTLTAILVILALMLAVGWSPLSAQQPSEMKSDVDSLFTPTPGTPQPANGNTPSAASLGLAESHLKNLASRRGRQRKIVGGLNLGVGVGFTILGGILLSDAGGDNSFGAAITTYVGQSYLLIGIAGVVVGTVTLAVPSRQERSYRNVLDFEDPLVREQQAEKELYDLARKAKVNRVIGSVFTGGLTTYLLFSNDNSSGMDSMIPFLAGSLILNIARKSLEERTLQAYLDEKAAAGTRMSMELGAGPTAGGGVVQLRLRF